jgi:hypothetical protein
MRNPFSSSTRLVLLVAVALASLPQAIAADDRTAINGTFAVTYVRPAVGIGCTAGTVPIEAQGIGSISELGPMFLIVRKCMTPNPVTRVGTYAGTFMLSTARGDGLSGTYAGQQDFNQTDANGFGPFNGTLTVTGGTGRFRHSPSGALSFTAVASPASVSETSGKFNGMAYYLIQGNMATHDRE